MPRRSALAHADAGSRVRRLGVGWPSSRSHGCNPSRGDVMAERAATLVLSGGGARGAFQVGAERVLREEFGFRWERIFGVSVGGLNGALLGQQQYGPLMNLWLEIRELDIYRKVPWPMVAFRIGVQQKLGFYDNSPLRALVQKYAAGRPFRVPVHVGRVSLVSGEFDMVTPDAPDFLDAVWQGATLPVLWEAIGPQAYVDGGVRNVSPLGDALQFNPTQIVVILCNSLGPDTAGCASATARSWPER
ncbi:MAG: patatin-like phospholipase family protein [Hyalangium sp.]|uniref:patatin-like phospholipase family protein n=1 Tax=Hyalangium sp. TaxID=2028555 RepID=UPI0038999EF3